MGWTYNKKYWKYNTDIFFKGIREMLVFKPKVTKNFRLYYPVNSKEALMRKIFKDYLNIVIDELEKGNAVVLGEKNVSVQVKEKDYYFSPYKDVYDELNSRNKIPYIYLNTGNLITKNREFLILPTKNRKEKFFEYVGKGGLFTKFIKGYLSW
jgi:hypothetical protein